ncbi:MAG: CAP domain-containing protein [Solirubrobacteraceae bacterium]
MTGFLFAVRGGLAGLRRRPRTALTASAILFVLPVFAAPAGARIPKAVSAHQASACPNANRPATRSTVPAMRAAVVCLINEQRAAHGLPALRADDRLNSSAQSWSNRMVATHSFTHGTNFAARISAAGFKWSSAGENIATGFMTPRQVVNGWMASAGHCENILSPTYRNVGTGVNRHAVGGYATGPATWTQDFALPMGRSAPSRRLGPMDHCPY